MASIQSKLWEFFLSPIYSRKANVGAELNIKLSRAIERPLPPRMIYKNNHVKRLLVNGRNVFIVEPNDLRLDKIIMYLHGGAYVVNITWFHWRLAYKLIKRTGIRLAMVDYPIAPENSHVDTHDMVMKVYEKLLRKYAATQIIFMGDSAGGGLSLALAQSIKIKGLPQPNIMILLSPWLDVNMDNPDIKHFEKQDVLLSKKVLITAGEHYAKGSDRKNHLISPIYGDFEDLAEIHLFMGTHDLLVADAQKLNHDLKNSNAKFHYYEYENMFHVWMFFPIPEAKTVLNRIIDLLQGNE